MKKRIIIYFAIITLLLTGCGPKYRFNKIPDDEISKAVYETLGFDVYYESKEKNQFDVITYYYVVESEEPKVLYEFVTAINKAIEENTITEKIQVYFTVEIQRGLTSIVVLSNYSDRELDEPDYGKLQYLYIVGALENVDEKFDFYNDPSTYLNLPDIRYLKVSKAMDYQAKEQDIDWYEVWPDLENVEIYYSY